MPLPRGQNGDDRASQQNARNRRPISCLPCRNRKLKCDRALPACGNCVNRGDITTCRYAPRKPEPCQKSPGPTDLSDSAQARIDYLEQLVLTLLKNSPAAHNRVNTPLTSIDADYDVGLEEADTDDHEHAEDGGVDPSDKQTTTVPAKPGTVISINAGHKERLSVNEAHWSDTLHRPSFNRQYERFWKDETKTSTAWVALLFAILRIAMLDYCREGDEPWEYKGKCQDLANTFRNRLTDCLILADCTRPQQFLIEALCLHLYGEYVSSRDAKSSIWVLSGMIIRLAMRMGYHQRSQPAMTSTIFQAEMCRRTWTHIAQADIMISFQLGLPSMIGLPSLAVALPRNIYDDQAFDEDCTVLPPALPDTEPTQVSYSIAKAKIVFGFARALDEISRSDAMRWERVLEIDRELRHIYENVPEHYKLGPLSSQDSIVLVSARFVLSSIHHKSLCVLHSRSLEIENSDDRFLYSRRVCLSSAMSILGFQAIQNQHIPVDGRMRSLTNYQTSLTIHDYLLAVTIITADLCSGRSAETTAGRQVMQGVPTRMEMIKTLGLSAQVFSQMRDQSVEAYKATDVLQMLVKKFEKEKQKDMGSRTGLQCVSKDQASASSGSALRSESGSSFRQRSPRVFSTAYDVSTSPSFSNGPNSNNVRVRRRQHLSRGPSRTFQSSQTNVSIPERSDPVNSPNPDDRSSWFDQHAEPFCPQSLPLAQMSPNFESTITWMMPHNPTVAPWPNMSGAQLDANEANQHAMVDDSSDSAMLAPSNPTSYSAAIALNDPMSALWNFSL